MSQEPVTENQAVDSQEEVTENVASSVNHLPTFHLNVVVYPIENGFLAHLDNQAARFFASKDEAIAYAKEFANAKLAA